jgi:hypothetical protein
MKRKVVFVLMLFVMVSCRDTEYRYYTRINADGSIYKRVTAVGDSSKIYKQPFYFDIANGWKLSYDTEIDKKNGDTLYMAIAEKTFESIKALNEDFNQKADSSHVDNIEIKMDSQFRWFFTFHTYKEVFKQRFPFRHVSIDDYLSPEEYAYFMKGDTSVWASMTQKGRKEFDQNGEGKLWSYLSVSMAIEYFNLLNQYAADHSYNELTKKDSLFIAELFTVTDDFNPDIEEFSRLIDKEKDTEWVSVMYKQGMFIHFERQLEDEVLILDEGKYISEIETPGLLYDTNATSVDENVAKWHFRRGQFVHKDYILFVAYRTTNYWAFVVTILVTLVLLMSFIKKYILCITIDGIKCL